MTSTQHRTVGDEPDLIEPRHGAQVSDSIAPGRTPAAQAAGMLPPSELDAVRQRRRLIHLEDTRAHLATVSAERRSHGLPDAEESYGLQLRVEDTIREEFPETYEERLPNWIHNDLQAEHPVGVLTAECSICCAIAATHGMNLIPPDAA